MPKVKKQEVLEGVTIDTLVAEGKCLSRVDNKVIFTEFTAPGDIVNLRIFRQKKHFAEASVIQRLSNSSLRVEPFCTYFGTCGGCKLQHIGYESQIHYKSIQVKDNLERLGKVKLPAINPILASTKDRYYRNKLEFSFSEHRWLTAEEAGSGEAFAHRKGLGFHIPRKFDKILDIETCYLQPEPSNQIRNAVREFAVKEGYEFFHTREMQGFLRTMMIRTSTLGQVMVLIQFFKEDLPKREALLSHLQNSFPQITSLLYTINSKGNDTLNDLEIQTFHGLPYIEERMEGLTFRINAKSFYQTNPEQAYELYKAARQMAGLTGKEVVYDLYTGTGTIANFIASQAKEVIGIEYVPEAIEDAKINSELNGIKNTCFYAGDMKDILTEKFLSSHPTPDVIITDPPRGGMHPEVIDRLNQLRCPRIVYISCNPSTQARDLQLMDELYEIKEVQPVDMFPHTAHVENIVLMELRK